jgi:hypothetical protein
MITELWALPFPIDVVGIGAYWVGMTIYLFVWTCSDHVARMGIWSVLVFWLLVAGCLNLGSWGWWKMKDVRRGNDKWEYDPHRHGSNWYGKRTSQGYQTQIKVEAQAGFGALAIGYGGALLLLIAAFFAEWLILGASILFVLRSVRRRRVRNPWWIA